MFDLCGVSSQFPFRAAAVDTTIQITTFPWSGLVPMKFIEIQQLQIPKLAVDLQGHTFSKPSCSISLKQKNSV